MGEEEKKRRRTIITILVAIGLVLLIYVVGIAVQYTNPELRRKATGSTWGSKIVTQPVTFNPITCYSFALTTGPGFMGVGMAGIGSVGLFFLIRFLGKGSERQDERNFMRSDKGTYGTSGWMTVSELKQILDWKPITDTTGTILGIKDGKVVSLPTTSRLNKHTAIYGASGTGKSRCFVRPQILQCVARGESVIITDPKGEIYADTAEFLRKRGYDVKMFNLVDPTYSDSWACLNEITVNPDQIELMAQTFVEVIIKNTGSAGGDKFWDNAESNLLKALCLYVCTDETRSDSSKNIGAVYEMLTNNDEKKLNAMFSKLPAGHPAIQPWNIFQKAGDNVRGNTIIGLGARLQVFQSDIIRKITTYKEIDLEGPAKRKSAYFVIMSDQDSTLDFLSSLFFSFLFIRLVRYADVKGKDGKCDVYVNFILDEFPNIGSIPDFTKKLSTIRSRELRVAVIFQNIAQLQNRYPDGLWEEIVGNCDTQLFLGCTDQMTAKFISTRTGEMTIEVTSEGTSKSGMMSISPSDISGAYKETKSVGKRFVLTADEVMRLPSNEALVILRGQKVLKVTKFDYSLHPGAKQFEHSYVRDYVPQWRAELSSKKFGTQMAESVEEVNNNVFSDNHEEPRMDGMIGRDSNTGSGGGQPRINKININSGGKGSTFNSFSSTGTSTNGGSRRFEKVTTTMNVEALDKNIQPIVEQVNKTSEEELLNIFETPSTTTSEPKKPTFKKQPKAEVVDKLPEQPKPKTEDNRLETPATQRVPAKYSSLPDDF